LVRASIAAALSALCAACELGSAHANPAREIAPAILFVRQGAATQVAAPDGSEARPFPSLRAALAAAPAGALLRIGEGVFRETVVITRPVVLLGRGAGRTRIVAPGPGGAAVEVRGTDHVQIHGLSIEGGTDCVVLTGGSHKLQRVELRGCAQRGLVGRGAQIELFSSAISDVSGGSDGRGIDIEGGGIEARSVILNAAGRRGIVLHHARGVLDNVEVRWSALSALQATAGADVTVIGGVYEGFGGAALYAGGSRLQIEKAQVRRGEYGVLAYRGAELSISGGELTDYTVAAVAIVSSHGSVRAVTIARGGTDAAISVTRADGGKPVLLMDNRISNPGPMGVHVTESSVIARGNTITGTRLDAEKDMGDAFYGVDSTLVIEENVMRGNAGSGITALRSELRVARNGFIENGRAGILLMDQSRGRATGNTFERNVTAGVELGERSRAVLAQNRFRGNLRLDIDAGCGKGLAGTADIGRDNLAIPGSLRQRSCSADATRSATPQ
jgi:hypothetical protein